MMSVVALTVYSIDGGRSPLTSWSAVYGYSIAHTYHGSAMSTCLPTILNIISEPNVSIVFWYMMFPVVLTVYSIDGGCSPLTSWSAVYGYSIAHTYHGSAMSTCLPTPPHNN